MEHALAMTQLPKTVTELCHEIGHEIGHEIALRRFYNAFHVQPTVVREMDSPDLLWEEEARGVILDIEAHVKEIMISPVLRSNNSGIYLNLTTLECQPYTVELSSAGFRTVAKKYDSIDENETGEYFDTPYALLSVFSPAFPESFANLLKSKLEGLNDNQEGPSNNEQ